jgi:SEC-C motif-containing protein
MSDFSTCECGSGLAYANCCGIVHQSGAGLGVTAEQLMRARYTAYVRKNDVFLLESWHPSTRPTSVTFDGVEWHGLTILNTEAGGALDATGTVEFTARFRRDTEHLELHEHSTFERVGGSWVYVAGS